MIAVAPGTIPLGLRLAGRAHAVLPGRYGLTACSPIAGGTMRRFRCPRATPRGSVVSGQGLVEYALLLTLVALGLLVTLPLLGASLGPTFRQVAAILATGQTGQPSPPTLLTPLASTVPASPTASATVMPSPGTPPPPAGTMTAPPAPAATATPPPGTPPPLTGTATVQAAASATATLPPAATSDGSLTMISLPVASPTSAVGPGAAAPNMAPSPTGTMGAAAATPTAAARPLARVDGGPDQVSIRLHQEPSPSSSILRLIRHGEQVALLAGPHEATGTTWWKVEYVGRTGWLKASDIVPGA